MNKRFKIYAFIWAILLVVFNVICFATPGEAAGMSKYGGAFWAGYIFITAAFLGQLVCAYIVLKTDDRTRLFYNIPILRISWTGLVVTLVIGGLCMVILDLPNWIGVIVCLLVLAFTAIAVVKANAAADIVEYVDRKVRAQTFFIKSLTDDAGSLMARAKTAEAKAACKKVYEALRYSDPMSNDALSDIEEEMRRKFVDFSDAVVSGSEKAKEIADEMVTLTKDRNVKCRRLK